MKLNNIEEKVVYWYMVLSWLLYFIGALYISGPFLGWFLTYRTFYRAFKKEITIHALVWLWVIAMLLLEIVMVVGQTNFGNDLTRIINASIFEWARQWALFGTFMLAGCLNIRPQVIYRAISIFCVQGVFFTLLFIGNTFLNIPNPLYTSPLMIIGRQGKIYYEIAASAQYEAGELRMNLFAGWAPGASFVLSCFFFLVTQEKNKALRYLAILGALLMNVVTVSRLGLICLPVVATLVFLIKNLKEPMLQMALGVSAFVGGIMAPQLFEFASTLKEDFTGARAASSKVRESLANIGLHRWETEAPIWGHGELDLVKHNVLADMPIGSHHTWVGLLFTKGLVGFFGFLIPFIASGLFYAIYLHKSKTNEVAFCMFMVMVLFSFGETVESLAYLLGYPIMIMSIAFKEATSVNNSTH